MVNLITLSITEKLNFLSIMTKTGALMQLIIRMRKGK